LLARLFTKPSNLLVMDEPTNDLDIETLELLEELLLDYSGTLLLVSHDRAFLNNVVTSTIVLEGKGDINEYAGGYDDWLAQRQPTVAQEKPKAKVFKEEKTEEKSNIPRKLSFKEERELEKIPALIEKLETEQDALYTALADVNFYQRPAQEIAAAKARLDTIEDELLKVFQRWEYLDGAKGNGG
jgi:ABC transport system ATP-binding/permease protein